MSNQTISVRFVTQESTAADYVAEIEKSGGKLENTVKPYEIPADLIDDYSDGQFEPLMLITGAVAFGFLIKRISDVWLDLTQGGQVVDTKGDIIVVREAPYLKRGTLVLRSKDGVEVFQPEDRDEALPLLEQIISAHG